MEVFIGTYCIYLGYNIMDTRFVSEDSNINMTTTASSSTFSMLTDQINMCYYEAFNMYRNKKGNVDTSQLMPAMRTAGANPTESELQV